MTDKFYDGVLVGAWLSGIFFGVIIWAFVVTLFTKLIGLIPRRPKAPSMTMSDLEKMRAVLGFDMATGPGTTAVHIRTGGIDDFKKHNPHLKGVDNEP